MSHSTTPAEIQLDKQELHEFVDKSSKWRMKTKGDIKEYATIFWYCCDPLITSHYMSLGECEELFWQGFHPDTRAQFPPDAKQQIWDILQRTPINDLVASTPAAPADPSPSPPLASDLVASMPPLSNARFSSTSPSSPPSLGRPKGPWPALATTTPLTSAAPMLRCPISVSPPSPIRKVPPPPLPTQSQPSLVSSPPPVRNVSPPSPIHKVLPPPSAQNHSSLVLPSPPPSLPALPSPSLLPPTPTIHKLPPPLPSSTPLPSQPPSPMLPLPLPSLPPLPSPLPPSPSPTSSPLPPTPLSPPPSILPSPLLPTPPSPSLPSPSPLLLPLPSLSLPPFSPLLPTPQIYELMPPPPSPITAASPLPTETTEAKPNSRQMQEQTDITNTENGDASPITKPEPARVPSNNDNHPDADIGGKPARDNSDDVGVLDNSSNRNCTNHPHNLSNVGSNSNSKFVYDPGRSSFDTKDDSTRVVDDDSISIGNEPHTADTHCSTNRDRDKTIPSESPSDANAVPPVPFTEATSPILNITTSCSADAFPTNVHRTDAPVLSFEAIDDDEDFTQHAHPHCDRRFPDRLRMGNFVSTDLSHAPAHTCLLAPDFAPTHPALPLNDEDPTANNNNSNSNSDHATNTFDSTRTTDADAVIKSSSSDCKNTSNAANTSATTSDNKAANIDNITFAITFDNSSSNLDTVATTIITFAIDALTLSCEASGNDSSAQRTRPRRDRCLQARYRTDNFICTDPPRISSLLPLAADTFHIKSKVSSDIEDTDTIDVNNRNKISNSSIIDDASCGHRNNNVNNNNLAIDISTIIDNNNSSTSNNTIDTTNHFSDTPQAAAVTHTINTTSNSNSNFNDNAASFVDIARILNADRAVPRTAHDDELKHKCACMPPLVVNPQAPPIAAPLPDKPGEPPPAPCTDPTPSAPNLQAVQDTRPLSLFSLAPFHIASG